MCNLFRGPSIDAFYKVLVHAAKNCLWWPCLLMDQNKMSNLYRGLSIEIDQSETRNACGGQSETRIACGGHGY
jgi:hypothetical protein